MKRYASLLALFMCFLSLPAQVVTEQWVREHYTKREVMIPMRDGVRLFTAVYEPVARSEKHPLLITRTPYQAGPYGEKMSGQLWGSWNLYANEQYIFVIQDVRGRWMSEGEFVDVRPFNPHKQGKKQIDEASDVYDTVEWLLKNTCNNGKAGLIGSSYSGFYSIMGALSGHPAVKAVCPQAPVTDWYMGDDFHHNGALILCDAFRFHSSVGRPRPVPTRKQSRNSTYYRTDEYSFFLKAGAVKNLTSMLGDSIQFWKDMMQHPHYDAWWKSRDARSGCYGIKPAVLVVGGLFDAEDCYGAWELYKAIRKQSPETPLQLVMGPWSHGGWRAKEGSYLGNIRFGGNTTRYYQQQLEFPFLNHYLKDASCAKNEVPATVFFSGENRWRKFPAWPPAEVAMTPLYLQERGGLSFQAPSAAEARSEYVSDPSNPVPYTDKTQRTRAKEYMTDDQRFADRRPDVLSFVTPLLTSDVTLGGELLADLKVALSTTDADFVVKLIDVFPDDFVYNDKVMGKGNGQNYLMNGYQMLVRGEVMRGKYRNSFELPEPFVPGQMATVSFRLPDIAHTFQRGHRIMVQIQSSWFPLVDRNPQQFTDIYHCDDAAFVKSAIQLFHQKSAASAVYLPVLRTVK